LPLWDAYASAELGNLCGFGDCSARYSVTGWCASVAVADEGC
jgi:hypothetical protein